MPVVRLRGAKLYAKVRAMFRSRTLRYAIALSAFTLAAGACATKEVRDDDFGSDRQDAGDLGAGNINNPDSGNGIGQVNPNTVEVQGVTYAPNGKLPLAGVLVYWTATEPEDIPEGVYCDTCVELNEGTSVSSDASGKFKLDIPADREVFLVVQKGQFRRVRKINLSEDDDKLDKELTTLPGKMDRADGDTVPTIAIMTKQTSSSYDIIHDALDKLGVEDYEFLNSSSSASDKSVTEDIDQLSKYQIVMFPCGSGDPTAAEQETLKQYAERGGKIYTSDHALDYISMTFGEVASGISTGADGLSSSCGGEGGACGSGRFNDDALSAWMDATGDSSVELVGIYSKFSTLNTMPFPGVDGSTTDVTPKLWSEVEDSNGNWKPASFSFTYGCGRGMFSIFHAHSNGNDLAPQEKALLFMLLEVSSCVRPGGDVH